MKAGADGYLLKDTEPDELIELLRQASSGEKAYSSVVAKYLRDVSHSDVFDSLTDRESQILAEVAKGIATSKLRSPVYFWSDSKVYMKSLLKKLRVPSRTAATVLYLERYGELRE